MEYLEVQIQPFAYGFRTGVSTIMSILLLLKQGGVSLFPLGVCSLLVLAVVLERIWTYSHIGSASLDLFKRVERALSADNRQEAVRLLNASPSPFARIAKASIEYPDSTVAETADALMMACEVEIASATKPLPILGTIGNIAPFIGLFGTVLGIMRAFKDVASQGSTGSTTISLGISEALIATAVGLGVGITAVIANNWCGAWVDNYRRELDHFATRWSHRLAFLQSPVGRAMGDDAGASLLSEIDTTLEPVA